MIEYSQLASLPILAGPYSRRRLGTASRNVRVKSA